MPIFHRVDGVATLAAPPPYVACRQFHAPYILKGNVKTGGRCSPVDLDQFVLASNGLGDEGNDMHGVNRHAHGDSRPQTRGTVASTVASGLSEFNNPEGHELWLSGAQHEQVKEDEYLPKLFGHSITHQQKWKTQVELALPVVWH